MLVAEAMEILAWIVWPLVLVFSTAVDALFCGMEMGVYVVNKIRLDLRAEAGSRAARTLRGMIRHPRNLLTVLLLGTNVMRYASTFSITSMFVLAGAGARAEWYTLAAATPLLFVLADSVPKSVFQRQGERLAYRFAWALRAADLLFKATGLSPLVRGVSAGLMRLTRAGRRVGAPAPVESLSALLAEGYASGVMTHPQSIMADRVMRISEVTLSDVLTPLSRAAAVPRGVSRAEVLEFIRHHNHSRLPMLGEGGEVVGVLDVYDVLAGEGGAAPADLAGEPLVLPDTLDVTAALYRMQTARRAMAIVADARGRHVGLVTVKDLVEEIVGEIEEW